MIKGRQGMDDTYELQSAKVREVGQDPKSNEAFMQLYRTQDLIPLEEDVTDKVTSLAYFLCSFTY